MSSPLNIVIASSEAVPFSKTGGLADVSGALCKELSRMGHRVYLIVPYYPSIYRDRPVPTLSETSQTLTISLGYKQQSAQVLWSELPGCNVTVLHIHQPSYFDRSGLYQENGWSYYDNGERFIFFSRAVMEAMRAFVVRPDIIHANDWQTGLVPALLKLDYQYQAGFRNAASIFTIHNMLFQGEFPAETMNLTGLNWKHFNWQEMEAYSSLNLLKTGIVFADKVNTVSPTYAKEIQTPQFGCHLESVLQSRGEDLSGILNGIDTEEWNPEIDPALPVRYSVKDYQEGKAACKQALQEEVGLPVRADVPLIGMITRLAGQKGLDLISAKFSQMLSHDVQFVFLGTGESEYENLLRSVAEQYPDKVSANIMFREDLAHRIEAASDIFLMPSAFEPCGLNQMYSMNYGSVPLVHCIGGLADTVIPVPNETLSSPSKPAKKSAKRTSGKSTKKSTRKASTTKKSNLSSATGFSFPKYDAELFYQEYQHALKVYQKPEEWAAIIKNGMKTDFSWKKRANEYVKLYLKALGRS